ncbi:hypothetical protein [Novosphingobium sp.]|uniref:hypothetical protein n=2 Tax=unclassified Novosphingobium TaxID=2644732 RepID=UPI003D6DA3CE
MPPPDWIPAAAWARVSMQVAARKVFRKKGKLNRAEQAMARRGASRSGVCVRPISDIFRQITEKYNANLIFGIEFI